MTLAQRLLLAIGVLTVVSTAALGLGVREAWRHTEEDRFRGQFEQAFAQLQRQLRAEIRELPVVIGSRCRHDTVLDGALVDLRSGQLDPGRRLALSLHVPEMMEAMRLDELTLVTDKGEILGAGHAAGLVGTTRPDLATRLAGSGTQATVRTDPLPLAVVAHCARRDRAAAVGLVAARHLRPLLDEISSGYGVTLSISPVSATADTMVQKLSVPELGGMPLFATQPRLPLVRALRSLDVTILALGAGTFGAALLLAMLLSRGLARPIVLLSRQARAAAHGDLQPVRGRGGRELEELADSFNQAIHDLVSMRRRLAATERIAARREIARRVAHEIKNPLAPIRAAVETLRRLHARSDPAFDGYFDEATRTVLDEVARISNIVSEFTRFARLPPPNPAAMDLLASVRKVVSLHQSSGAAIQLDAEPCPEVVADQDQIVQVMTNLLQNALDACRDVAEPRVGVQVRLEAPGNVILSVTDNGPGVAPEMRDRLFEPYATTKSEGTGLGLAIVHRIVVEHGGDIAYREVATGGAEFRVSLPVNGPTLLPEPPPSSRLGSSI